eukprot:TRINITY_DN13224_c1_g1_i1.p1 TRINITY_DN13224_c1_g1~~TRINITY_DN13224_c1_g1_i1.p1  ORF type:complete len:110 (-),score=31.98 TRINITY_DN13224_c1_g1_i1:306-605(-)
MDHKEDLKNYYMENKEAIKAKAKLYRINNKMIISERDRFYYINNKKPRKNRMWSGPAKVVEFFERARELLFVKEVSDWYRISRKQMGEVGGRMCFVGIG